MFNRFLVIPTELNIIIEHSSHTSWFPNLLKSYHTSKLNYHPRETNSFLKIIFVMLFGRFKDIVKLCSSNCIVKETVFEKLAKVD